GVVDRGVHDGQGARHHWWARLRHAYCLQGRVVPLEDHVVGAGSALSERRLACGCDYLSVAGSEQGHRASGHPGVAKESRRAHQGLLSDSVRDLGRTPSVTGDVLSKLSATA